ncbi:MAG TPA: DUF4153 domain-containing protein, partial [Allosphingosinicella sp.]
GDVWPLRPVILLLLGALFGFLVFRLAGLGSPSQLAAASFLTVGGIVFAFSLERLRWGWSVTFAILAGAVVALVVWWNGPEGNWAATEGWRFFAALLAVAGAVPLFQAARDEGNPRFDTSGFHRHAWTNLILWFAAWAFVAAVMLLLLLLGELFSLLGLGFVRGLYEDGPGAALFTVGGGAFGAAVGLLRDRDAVLDILQRVVRAILSVLAPVLAFGLVLFVLAIPFTGLASLWSQTRAATPILLLCVAGAVLLVNAVAGNGEEDEAKTPILRWSAMALIAVTTPLAAIAAVSLYKRIDQHGFTPDRLWAAVFVAAAFAFALAYAGALFRGRLRWPARLRRANVHLVLELSLLAFFLALPIVNFGSISARDQLGRVTSGAIPPDRFDWAAMRFDFGKAGVEALMQLAEKGRPELRQHAIRALAAKTRWALEPQVEVVPAPPPRATSPAP